MKHNKQQTPIFFQITHSTRVKCKRCGYIWEYGGKLKRGTCPNCGNKNNIKTNSLGEKIKNGPKTKN